MKWGQEAAWAWGQPRGLTIPAWAAGASEAGELACSGHVAP